MAYARYSRSCEWYIFWEDTQEDEAMAAAGQPKPKAQATLAIWHASCRAVGPRFTYAQVNAMLRSGDFTAIPGFTESSRALLTECLTEFCQDVDQEYDQPT